MCYFILLIKIRNNSEKDDKNVAKVAVKVKKPKKKVYF